MPDKVFADKVLGPELTWRPHPILPDHSLTTYRKCSVVFGPYSIGLYEVMTPDGDVHGANSLERLVTIVDDYYKGEV